MKYLLLLIAFSIGCNTIPEEGAHEACLRVYDGYHGRVVDCGLNPGPWPSREEACANAYAVDEEQLDGVCLPWIQGTECPGFIGDGSAFKDHCGTAVLMRGW